MTPMATALIFTGMLLAALLVEPVTRFLRIPFATLLVLVGFAGSELLVHAGVDTGVRWYHVTELILNVFLPVLVFHAAFHMDVRQLVRRIAPVLYLAVPVFVLATVAVGAGLYFGINHPTGFPWPVALLAGVILGATDPGPATEVFNRLKASPRARTLLEGESLFNDTTAIVLFSIVLTLATTAGDAPDVPAALVDFARAFTGGLLLGLIIGVVGVGLMFTFTGPIPCAVISLAAIMFSIYLGSGVFQVSGVMAVLGAGLITGEANRRFCRIDFLTTLWEFNGYLANALIFLLMGVTITLEMFRSQWLAMIIGITVVLAVRGAVVWSVMIPPRLETDLGPERGERVLLFWGGMRGSVTLALALAIPVAVEGWYTVQAMAYGVVLFGLVVQGWTLEPLIRRVIHDQQEKDTS